MTVCTASVAISSAAASFDKKYTYIVPSGLEDKLKAGMRVLVPFGHGEKHITALVMDIAWQDISDKKLKSIISAIDSEPLIGDEMLAMTEWLKETCFCTYYDAYRSMVPAGFGYKIKTHYKPALADISEAELTEEEAELMRALMQADSQKAADELFVSNDAAEQKRLSRLAASLADKGALEKTDALKRNVGDKTELNAALSEEYIGGGFEGVSFSAKQKNVLKLLGEAGSASAEEICYMTGCTRAVIKRLADKGAIRLYETQVMRAAAANVSEHLDADDIILLSSHPDIDKNELYDHLDVKKTKEVNSKLPESSRIDNFASQQSYLNDKLNDAKNNLNNATDRIRQEQENINNSNLSIEKSNQAIEEYNTKIKQTKKTIKALTKEEKKALEKVLKSSRVSKLDKVAVISKMKTKRLLERIDNYNNIKNQKDNQMQNLQYNIDMSNLERENINLEQENIIASKESIKEAKDDILTSSKAIRQTEIKIKQLDRNKKKILANKLKNKPYNYKDKIMTVSKQNIVRQQEKITPVEQPKESNKENNIVNIDIGKVVSTILNFIEQMAEIGINFGSANHQITQANLPQQSIATCSKEQLQTLSNTINNYLLPVYNNNQSLENGRSRTLSKSGYVNIGLLSLGLIILTVLVVLLSSIMINK